MELSTTPEKHSLPDPFMPTSKVPLLPPMIKASIGSHGADDVFEDRSIPPHRDPLILREQVLHQLRCIIDPDLYRDIVSLGFVKDLKINYDDASISFTLELTTPACPVKETFVSEAERLLTDLEWVNRVDITLSSRKTAAVPGNPIANLADVSHIIAVASCKGGVGKSSVSVNFAYMLSRLGARVGLVDADVYGPSMPYIIGLEAPKVYFRSISSRKSDTTLSYETDSSKMLEKRKEDMQKALATGEGGLIPLVHEGVKLMSYGYLKTSGFAAVRGPIASNIVLEMASQTLWGELDYLIIDLPPGTGDIHLTLAQSIPITATIMVTTPQQLSLVDVEKGILMFNEMKIPTIAVVENMSHFICPCCNSQHDIFAKAGQSTAQKALEEYRNVDRLAEQFGVVIRSQLPLSSEFATLRFIRKADTSDTEEIIYPFVLAFDEKHPVWSALRQLSEDVIREVSAMKFARDRVPNLRTLDDGTLEMVVKHHFTRELNFKNLAMGEETVFYAPCREVRLNCRCAECVDEFTGKAKLNSRKVPADIRVLSMKQSGNYAVSINWSDGHQSLLAFATLQKLFTRLIENSKNARGDCIAEEAEEW